MPLESILCKISRYGADLSDSVFHWDISRGHNCENYDSWLIGQNRYIYVWLKDTAWFFFFRSTVSAHRNANEFLEDLVSKDYILYIVDKKAKHTINGFEFDNTARRIWWPRMRTLSQQNFHNSTLIWLIYRRKVVHE
jgi:hypothetical protein